MEKKGGRSLFDLMDLSLIQQDALDDTLETNSPSGSFINGRDTGVPVVVAYKVL